MPESSLIVVVVLIVIVLILLLVGALRRPRGSSNADNTSTPSNDDASPVDADHAHVESDVDQIVNGSSSVASSQVEQTSESDVADERVEELPEGEDASLATTSPANDPDAETQEKPKATVTGERVLVNATAVTDVGLKRKNNEDAFATMPAHNIYALADGMGSQAAGEVASKLTMEAITDAVSHNLFLSPDETMDDKTVARRLTKIVQRANRAVLSMSKEIPEFSGMGTTVVLAQFSPNKRLVHIAHVGDSRCYRIRDGEIVQLTKDHTLGAFGIHGKTSSMLARAVGVEENLEVEITRDHPAVGDVYLLCSDGLSGMASDDDILKTVESLDDLDEIASALIELAKKGGGKDNVTIVLVRVDEAVG